MLISTLGLANSWSEDEIWQGLSSLANRKKIHALDTSAHVSVLPKIIVFVDGVDESSLQDKWIEQVQETSVITHNYPSIRFCFMSRPYVFMGKNTGGRVVNLDITGDVPTYKLFDSYVKAYNVDASSAGWVKYALTTPLSLKLFCELNKGKAINYHSGADVSVAALLKEKIRLMEIEFCKQDSSATVADQSIFKSILMLANSFRCTSCIERSQIVISIEQLLSVDMAHAQMLASYLENYGILRPYCKHGSGLLSPDIYYYYPGIQGYFDYALALMLIDECKTPQNIDFNNCKNLSPTAFYTLAIVSIQKFAYLITDNESIDSCIDKSFKEELSFFSHIAKKGPEFAGISSAQLILSAAYQFITMCGWNNEFRYRKVGERTIRGVDWAISGSHLPKTHGSQSPVMTICEKYVWQARNYIMGFFADRLMIIDDDGGASYVDDYGMLDDFLIPALESGPIDPDSMNDLYPWHIPEKDVVIIPGVSNSQADVKHAVEASPDITWKEWVQINNIQRQYPIDADELIALSGYSRFESPVGVETNLYLSAILVATSDVDSFISAFNENSELSCGIANPSDWKGACCANCYITPKEVCWMPWKKRYDSSNVDYFPESKIHSGVDKCTYNFIEYGDVYYELPSTPIRKMLKITDTDGYLFCDRDKQIKAANILAGENRETQQRYLLVDKNLLENVTQSGNTLLWIMREDRRENGKARERFGDFYEEKDRSYIGFFRNGEFVVIQIPACDVQNSGAWEADDLATDILHQYGYVDESCKQAE